MPIKEYEKYRQYLRTLTVKGLQQEFYQQTNPLYLTMIKLEAVLRRHRLQGSLSK